MFIKSEVIECSPVIEPCVLPILPTTTSLVIIVYGQQSFVLIGVWLLVAATDRAYVSHIYGI